MQNEPTEPIPPPNHLASNMQHPFFGTLLRLVVLCGSWSRASASFWDFLGVDFLESLYVLEFLLDPISMIRKRKIQCIVKYAFLRTGDYGNFDEYNRYFRDDSVMALKQTGIYKGAESSKNFAIIVEDGRNVNSTNTVALFCWMWSKRGPMSSSKSSALSPSGDKQNRTVLRFGRVAK